MKKLLPTTVLCFIICFLPLIGKWHLYVEWSFLIIVFFFYLLFFTQPTFRASDIKGNAETDKYSMLFITIALVLTLSGSIVDWGYFQLGYEYIDRSTLKFAGITLLILGSAIRIWAIVHLGKYFTNTVRFDSEHILITTGPYAWVRHPSYLGAYLAIIGSALFLQSIVFFTIGLVVMLAAYIYRIRVEEVGLMDLFPEEYNGYRKKVKGLFPFLY
ncbi:MAG: isoprenylcysteine carboxylmethyltransferase family protein [Saprospiraceae bacterium]|nr:isoprenylcysteine carboxylmethyltransferase family protein [Saprospiraceae bacterium]